MSGEMGSRDLWRSGVFQCLRFLVGFEIFRSFRAVKFEL